MGRIESVPDRDDPNVVPLKDERQLLDPEMIEKAPYYVLRLLSGANVFETGQKDIVCLRSCGREFAIKKKALDFFNLVKTRVKSEHMDTLGIIPPFDIEAINTIFFNARRIAKMEGDIPPEILRVLFFKADETGCWFYRTDQPSRFLQNNELNLMHVEQSDWISHELGTRYDMIVFPRASDPTVFGVLRSLQKSGKIVVYETDDNMFKLPDWNPGAEGQSELRQAFRKEMMERADGIIVSTEQLGETTGRPDNTYVCHNGIDDRIWPTKPIEQPSIKHAKLKGEKVRVLWAGSATHDKDIDLLSRAVTRLVKEFPDTLEFYFVGALPPKFACAYTRGGVPSIGVDRKYDRNIKFHPGCHVMQWSDLLSNLGCHIGVAPLVQHEFNESKSEIKVLEFWAMGMAVAAADIAPYQRAITHEEDGLLVKPDEHEWYKAMRRLIVSQPERKKFSEEGLKTLEKRYLIKDTICEYERAILSIARGRIIRPECNEMIEKRLEEKG